MSFPIILLSNMDIHIYLFWDYDHMLEVVSFQMVYLEFEELFFLNLIKSINRELWKVLN